MLVAALYGGMTGLFAVMGEGIWGVWAHIKLGL